MKLYLFKLVTVGVLIDVIVDGAFMVNTLHVRTVRGQFSSGVLSLVQGNYDSNEIISVQNCCSEYHTYMYLVAYVYRCKNAYQNGTAGQFCV